MGSRGESYYVPLGEHNSSKNNKRDRSMMTTILLLLIAGAAVAGLGVIAATYANLPSSTNLKPVNAGITALSQSLTMFGATLGTSISGISQSISGLSVQMTSNSNGISGSISNGVTSLSGSISAVSDGVTGVAGQITVINQLISRSKYAYRQPFPSNFVGIMGQPCDQSVGASCTIRQNSPWFDTDLNNFELFTTIDIAGALGYDQGAENTIMTFLSDEQYIYYVFETPLQHPAPKMIELLGGIYSTDAFTSGRFAFIWLFTNPAVYKTVNTYEGQGPSIFIKIEKATGRIVLWKHAYEVTGKQTIDIHTIEGTGNDVVRGTMVMYNDYIYFNNYVVINPGTFKMDKNFNFVWRWTAPEEYRQVQSYDDLHVNVHYGLKMGSLSVIPPIAGKTTEPIIVTSGTGGAVYFNLDILSIERITTDYYKGSQGMMFALNDDGDRKTAPSLRWKFSSCPEAFVQGNFLSEDSFIPGHSIAKIYYPLKEGLVFKNMSVAQNIPETAGSQFLIIPVDENDHFNMTNYHHSMKKEFYFPHGHVFSAHNLYNTTDGSVTNIPGSIFLAGTPYYGNASQPIVKQFRKEMAGNYVLDKDDAYFLNHYGGGFHNELFYDSKEQTIIAGTGNGYFRPHGETEYAWKEVMGFDDYFAYQNPNLSLDGTDMIFQSIIQEITDLNGQRLYDDILGNQIGAASSNNGVYGPLYLPDLETNKTVVLEALKHFWDKFDNEPRLRNISPRANRYFYDSVISLDVLTGALKFVVPTFPMPDEAEHSLDLAPLLRGVFRDGTTNYVTNSAVPNTFFVASGYNQDNTGMFVTTLERDTGAFTKGQRVMVTISKSRSHIFDYDFLVNNQTYTHVTNDTSIDYKKGLPVNDAWDNALLWAEKTTFISGHNIFSGYAFDGEILVRRSVPLPMYMKIAALSYFDTAKPLDVYNGWTNAPGIHSGFNKANQLIQAYNIYDLLSDIEFSQMHPLQWSFVYLAETISAGRLMMDTVHGDELVHFGSNKDLYYFLNKSDGSIKKTLNFPGGISTLLVQDNAIYFVPGETKYQNGNPTVFLTTMFMYTPFGR